LCFPKDCVFEGSRNLKSFAGAEDETQPRSPSTQALAASLGQKDVVNNLNNQLTVHVLHGNRRIQFVSTSIE
jgi:hypothetical protein